MSEFAFGALLKAGVAAGLRPAEVWAMTPAELQLIVGPARGAVPLARDGLERLSAAYPDEEMS